MLECESDQKHLDLATACIQTQPSAEERTEVEWRELVCRGVKWSEMKWSWTGEQISEVVWCGVVLGGVEDECSKVE